MCPPPEPCASYDPDYERAKASGHLCFGMGYSPPCRRCGRSEMVHNRSRLGVLLSDLDDNLIGEFSHDLD